MPSRRAVAGLGFVVLLLTAWFAVPSMFPQLDAGSDGLSARDHHDRLSGIGPQMSAGDQQKMNWYLGEIAKEVGVDIHIVFADLQDGQTLEGFASRAASERGIGRKQGAKGILLAYDRRSGRLRLEVGYGLEGWFSDAFIGYLLEDHAAAFFRSGDLATGLRVLMRIVHERIRDELIGGTFDATPFVSREAAYVSGGAGATTVAVLGDEGLRAFQATGPAGEGFDPQPTPSDAYRLYLEWLRQGKWRPDVPLFTPESRRYLASLPITTPYMDHMLATVWGERFEIVERGDWALLYYTSTPLRSPMYLRRGEDGWQFDIVQEVHATVEVIGQPLTWTLTGSGAASHVFEDLYIRLGRFTRIRRGDNTPLPRPR